MNYSAFKNLDGSNELEDLQKITDDPLFAGGLDIDLDHLYRIQVMGICFVADLADDNELLNIYQD